MLAARSRFDYSFAGFLGQPLVPALWLLHSRPIVYDAFLSIYDTLCLDRQQFGTGSPVGRIARWLDTWSARKSDLVLTDTPASARFMTEHFSTDSEKLLPVPVGADESVFYPRTSSTTAETMRILYLSTYLPLHGVPTVVEAANILKDRATIQFLLVGRGPERAKTEQLANDLGLDNIRFIDWIPLEDLAECIASRDVFLGGHFSSGNEKARRVVAGKIYQGLAMAKPTIVGDCEATREWFSDGDDVQMVTMGDSEALAEAIAALADSASLRDRLGSGGRALFEQRFSEESIAQVLDERLEAVSR